MLEIKRRKPPPGQKLPPGQKKHRSIFRIMRGERSKTSRSCLLCKSGEGYIDVIIMCMATMLVFCTLLSVAPVFLTKLSLDNYANELAREAEIAGRVGSETTDRLNRLNDTKGLFPAVKWERAGNIQIGQDVTVTVSANIDIGFYVFGSIPIRLTSTATGTSEVLWK